jgi:rod shape-determining protein MreD
MSGFQSHRHLSVWGWLWFPFLICVAASILVAIPLKIFGIFRLPEPIFALVPAFAWAVIRPSLVPPFLLLGLGLFLDLLRGGQLGLWATGLLLGYAFVLATRPLMIGQSRPMMWAWFAATCLVTIGAAYLLTMLDALVTPNPLATFWQLLVTVLLYPFAHRLIARYEDADVRFR